VKHVIAAGADDALTTHTNNFLEDTSLKPELEHAGVNSDEVESGFGNVDFTGHQLGTCGTVGVFGVAQARKLGAFLTFEAFVKRGKKQAGKKAKKLTREDEKEKRREEEERRGSRRRERGKGNGGNARSMETEVLLRDPKERAVAAPP
jgi:hypothetical protein